LSPEHGDGNRAGLEPTEAKHSVPFTWGILALLRQDWAQAEHEIEAYLSHVRELSRLDMVGCPLALLALSAYRLGNLFLAQQHLVEALESAERQGYFLALSISLAVLALFVAEAGNFEQAVELYATANRHPAAADAQWFQDILCAARRASDRGPARGRP
jgi:tetratricopeptide (TPR) repeat protein